MKIFFQKNLSKNDNLRYISSYIYVYIIVLSLIIKENRFLKKFMNSLIFLYNKVILC